jgi:hypothetical protein
MEPALKGRDLIPGDYIENWQDECPDEESLPFDGDGDGCLDDADNDGVVDLHDLCPGFDDSVDDDVDQVPDACDDSIDSDGDSVPNDTDICRGFDDRIDLDNDSIPDGCDEIIDSDNDGVSDNNDLCFDYNDSIDEDMDGIPDGCDEIIDSDGDGVSNLIDACPSTEQTNLTLVDAYGCAPYQVDTDNDGINDQEDVCEGFNDNNDSNQNGIPDDCEQSQSKVEGELVTAAKETDDSARITIAILSLALVLLVIYWRKR